MEEHVLVGLARLHADDDVDLARLGELDRVVGEVDEDLAQAQRVADQVGRARSRPTSKTQLQPLGRGLLGDQVGHVVEHLLEVEVDVLDRQLAGLDLREVEDVVDDAEQVLAGALDLLDVVALARRQLGLAAPGATCR